MSEIISKRLKEARLIREISQTKLGILAGMNEDSASAQMNQYETAKHEPKYEMVCRISKVLDVPEYYFYIQDDQLAHLILYGYTKKAITSNTDLLVEEFLEADLNQCFDEKTTAKIRKCSVATLQRDRHLGQGIPYIKIGRSVKYWKRDILKWMNSHEVATRHD